MANSAAHMTIPQAQRLAEALMRAHGLTDAGWSFKWGNGKRRLGAAETRRARDPITRKPVEHKAIRLSRHLVALNPEPVVRDVILHEIAHALVGIEAGHSRAWREMCLKIGAKPQRLADEGVRVIEGRYAIVCTACDAELGRRHRRVSPAKLAKSYCRACGPRSTGKLAVITHTDDALPPPPIPDTLPLPSPSISPVVVR